MNLKIYNLNLWITCNNTKTQLALSFLDSSLGGKVATTVATGENRESATDFGDSRRRVSQTVLTVRTQCGLVALFTLMLAPISSPRTRFCSWVEGRSRRCGRLTPMVRVPPWWEEDCGTTSRMQVPTLLQWVSGECLETPTFSQYEWLLGAAAYGLRGILTELVCPWNLTKEYVVWWVVENDYQCRATKVVRAL